MTEARNVWMDGGCVGQYRRYVLTRADGLKFTIAKPSKRGAQFHGWVNGEAHRYGPFEDEQQARRWAEKFKR